MSTYIWERAGWPQWRWSESAVTEILTAAQRKRDYLAGLAQGLSADHVNLAITEFMTRETVSTSAIEGVTLDADEVRSSIMKRLGLGVSEEHPNRIGEAAKGVIDVLADSTQNVQTLTLERLFAWQQALFPTARSGLRLILVGMLRGPDPMQVLSGSVGHERVNYEAPPRDRLDAEMEKFLAWFNVESKHLDNTLRACIAHLWFETLHPFEDGNGRLGRAVFDLALAQGMAFHSERTSRLWAVSQVILNRRKEYYALLERTQKGDLDITEWLQWSVECVVQACDEARLCIDHVVDVAKFWARHRNTPLNPRQRKALEIALSSTNTEDSWLTAKRVARWTKVERVTASRDLAQMEQLGLIRRDPEVGGRSTRYFIRLDSPEPLQLIESLNGS